MKIGAIIWGGTSLSCLTRSARGLKGVKLTAFSMRQLEDIEEAKKSLISLQECDVILLYLSSNEVWEQIKPEIEAIGKDKPVICLSHDPELFKYSTVQADIVKTCYEYLTMGG